MNDESAPQTVDLDIIFDVHRCRAQMQLAAADRRLFREDANLRHQIVMNLRFDLMCGIQIDVVAMRAQIGDLFRRDESRVGLRFRQRDPNGAPQTPAFVLRKERTKFRPPISP